MNNAWQSQYLFVWVFDVGRGIATFVRTPENYGLNIDCGGDGDNRPLARVEKLVMPRLGKYQGKDIAQAVMSHPHTDHYRDIHRMVTWDPAYITCPNDKEPIEDYPDERFNFDLLRTKEEDEPLLEVYKECYDGTGDYRERKLPLQVPAFGVKVPNFQYGLFYIRPPTAEDDLPKDDYVNNCSIMAFIRYGRSSILLPGDMMTSGMDHAINTGSESRLSGTKRGEAARVKTVDEKAFNKWIREHGCKFLVAPHHGLESAWPEALFDVLDDEGHQVSLALVSEKSNPGENDGEVDGRYSSEDYVKGYDVWNDSKKCKKRLSVTTRSDGNILMAIPQTGRPTVVISKNIDWLLSEAPRAIVAGNFKRAMVAY